MYIIAAILGIALCIVSVVAIKNAGKQSQGLKKKSNNAAFSGIMALILSAGAAIFGFMMSGMMNSDYNSETANMGNVVIVVFLLGGIAFLVWSILAGKKLTIEQNGFQKSLFYDECRRNGITTIDSEKDRQRAELIAKKFGLDSSDLDGLFRAAEDEKRAAVQRENAVKNAELLKQEKQLYVQMTKYVNLTGREKRIAMLQDLYKMEYNMYQAIMNGGWDFADKSQQKEHDVAIHAGIANGLAGGAAAIITAANVAQKNAQIRQQNAENRVLAAHYLSACAVKAKPHKDAADRYESEKNAAATKLLGTEDTQACFKKIRFSDVAVSVSGTGTCTVVAKAKLDQPLMIFDDVKAVVDGVVTATILEDSRTVGTAKLTIPAYGLSDQEATLEGMSLICGEPGKNYTAKISPDHLWTMEA